MNDNDVKEALNKAINYYGLKVKTHLSAGRYPRGNDYFRPKYVPIQNTQVVDDPVNGENEIQQTIRYGSIDKAPYAVAFEFGSGVHGARNQGTYRIEPTKSIRFRRFPGQKGKRSKVVNEQALAVGAGQFRRTGSGWIPVSVKALESSPKFAGNIWKNIYAMYYVDHPGIEARPFAEPVWLKEQNYITSTFGLDLFAVIVEDLKKI